ncbi:hypothetical protein O3M35_002581 [Rhynocoris fuscipes]|uniref:Uncharacterized protein n=1 Tax=Rhynocoris fuscipes TaxID=488301 RepID=A0AAW1CTH5_9HEMI
MNYSDTKWISSFMAYQWVNNLCFFIMTLTELFVGSIDLKDVVLTLSIELGMILVILKSNRIKSRTKQVRYLFDRLETIREIMLNDQINKHFMIEAENFGRTILITIFLSLAGYPIPAFFVNILIGFMTNFKEKNLIFKLWRHPEYMVYLDLYGEKDLKHRREHQQFGEEVWTE